MEKKKKIIPDTFVIVFAVIVFCAVLTWIIPGGRYVETQISTRDGAKTEMTFEHIENQPQTWQVLMALSKGFERQAAIIVFILIIGGTFWIINAGKSIDFGIFSFINRTKRISNKGIVARLGVNNIIITSVMLLFSIFGSVFGMSEETIAFTIIFIPLAISMGYDSIVGVCMVYVAAHVGFAGAVLNPFTIGIAQGIADIPLFSGFEYRLICWVILTFIAIFYVLRYAKRIKKNPKKSIMYDLDSYWRLNTSGNSGENLIEKQKTTKSAWVIYCIISGVLIFFSILHYETTINIGSANVKIPFLIPCISLAFILISFFSLKKYTQMFVLSLLGFTIIFLIIGVLGYSWYINEMSALFLALGLACGFSVTPSANNVARLFIAGCKDIFSAAIIVGLAGGIIIILEDGKIIDTILYILSGMMQNAGKIISISAMYVIQTLINIVIPSGSAKAAITMPIMAPFSDLIGISRQATVVAFQFGDGFTNMITPTSGVLIAVLGIARIPYAKWVKWVLPFILLLFVVGLILLVPTVIMKLNGF